MKVISGFALPVITRDTQGLVNLQTKIVFQNIFRRLGGLMAEKRKWLVTKVTVTTRTKEVRADKATLASSKAKKQGKWLVTEDDVAYHVEEIDGREPAGFK